MEFSFTSAIYFIIRSIWALPIKIVNAKKLLQVFAIFLNAFSILIGSGYSWFRCRYIGRSKAAYQRWGATTIPSASSCNGL